MGTLGFIGFLLACAGFFGGIAYFMYNTFKYRYQK